ncbi:MAG: hypothetical protein N3E50_04150 [Candidatus Goldbacteria bacterium]|nr:hypothetical protein [Candidatus Goldiibacteriota bacterium]
MYIKNIIENLKKFLNIIKVDFNSIFIWLIFIIISIYILLKSYFWGYYISHDSSYYLRAAKSILYGNWFYIDKLAGDDKTWFGVWPIGYPFFIALVSYLLGNIDIYLASKILSIIIIFFIILIFKIKFKHYAWLFTICLVNSHFLNIFSFTWSEHLFILGLLCFVLNIFDIISEKKTNRLNYLFLFLSCLILFFSRYIGLFSLIVILFFILIIFLEQKNLKIKDKDEINKIKYLSFVILLIFIFIILYLFMNKINSGYITGEPRVKPKETFLELLNQLWIAQKKEFNKVIFSFGGILIIFLLFDFILNNNIKNLVNNYIKNYKEKLSLYFIFIGFMYWLSIVYLRFVSYFDPFNYRLLYPATFLMVIGIILFFIENNLRFLKLLNYNKIGFIILFIIISLSLCKSILKQKTNGYLYIKNMTEKKYEIVPSKSKVLWMDRIAYFLRSDVIKIDVKSLYEINSFDDYINLLGEKNIFIDTENFRELKKRGLISISEDVFNKSKFYSLIKDENIKIIKVK